MESFWPHFLRIVTRTFVLYLAALAVFRILGKRSISDLAPFDLAVLIMIGEAATFPIAQDNVTALHGLVAVAALGAMHYILTWLNLRSRRLEQLTQGVPTLVVEKGRLLRQAMRKEHLSEDDILEELRTQGVDQLNQVERAWLEPSGKISVRKTKDDQPITAKDLKHVSSQLGLDELRQEIRRLKEDIERLLHDPPRQKT